jgi:2-oxo-4-hydroxy-4-carboxy-5-ureidoimidazoline decarboxylase
MSGVLARWNGLPSAEAAEEILPCCGSKAWAIGMASRRPIQDEAMLLAASDEVWGKLPESDWLEAFRSHPRIGESNVPASAAERFAAWSKEEQGRVRAADEELKIALAEGNRVYEEKFGRTFIVCATGKSPSEILGTIMKRLRNDERTELREAAEQQRQIAQLRLKKWLQA